MSSVTEKNSNNKGLKNAAIEFAGVSRVYGKGVQGLTTYLLQQVLNWLQYIEKKLWCLPVYNFFLQKNTIGAQYQPKCCFFYFYKRACFCIFTRR